MTEAKLKSLLYDSIATKCLKAETNLHKQRVGVRGKRWGDSEKGRITNGHKELLGMVDYPHYPHYGDDFADVYMCQSSSCCTL